MMSVSGSARSSASPLRSSVSRAAGFFTLWLILSGADAGGLPAGAVAVIAAAWTSHKLLPASDLHVSAAGLARLVVRFLRQSVVAGVDVARRALDPRLPLRPGFVTYPVRLTPGTARNAFCILSSLLPGTLPAGSDERGTLLIHCLDVGEPVAAQLSEEEALLERALGCGHG